MVCLQKAHVEQFVATEDALNKAAEAKISCQKLIRRLHGSNDQLGVGGTLENIGSLRQFEVILRCPWQAAVYIQFSCIKIYFLCVSTKYNGLKCSCVGPCLGVSLSACCGLSRPSAS